MADMIKNGLERLKDKMVNFNTEETYEQYLKESF